MGGGCLLSAVDKARVGRVEVLAYARLVQEIVGLVDGGVDSSHKAGSICIHRHRHVVQEIVGLVDGGGGGGLGAALALNCLH